tara:strand:+ start:1645 stop:2922 length:1278 start_codon:yes stop_codon:yes gene_type:complete
MSSPYQRFAYHTFGCKVNFADSCTIARKLIDKGLTEVSIDRDAEIYIINTCSVTENADKKAENFIRKLNQRSPESKIIVTGCYAQLNPEKIKEIPGVSKVINASNKFNINAYLDHSLENLDPIISVDNFSLTYSINERIRAFVKVQDGCDYVCSYCTIPMARGKSRSGSIKSIISSVKDIVSTGTKEIILSGINVGDFGKNNDENLFDLLNELENIDNLNRYRISSIEPNLLNDSIVEIISKSKKAVPHLHIPLQSGNDKILKNMKRRYSVADYNILIEKLNKHIKGVCIGVDVIVGYPNESEDDFIKTYNFLNKIDISYLHVFSYSDRKNTFSYNIKNKISRDTIVRRRKLLQQLSKEKFNNYINKNLNLTKTVLFENYHNGIIDGLTDNYIRVYVPGDKKLVNTLKNVKLVKNDINVYGELID